jgi:hypothetical protein
LNGQPVCGLYVVRAAKHLSNYPTKAKMRPLSAMTSTRPRTLCSKFLLVRCTHWLHLQTCRYLYPFCYRMAILGFVVVFPELKAHARFDRPCCCSNHNTENIACKEQTYFGIPCVCTMIFGEPFSRYIISPYPHSIQGSRITPPGKEEDKHNFEKEEEEIRY